MKDIDFMRRALVLAKKGFGTVSPNPMVGAVVVKGGKVIGEGWHRMAGGDHAEIFALREAGSRARGATLYVTLEPCSTHGRTPPCTEAIKAVGIKRVVVAATDPNPNHAGSGFKILRKAGIEVIHGILAEEAASLNEVFNHWIVKRAPFVTVKAAMTLDGKIATAAGESKWITGSAARAYGMNLRQGADGVLVGVNTILVDDPSLTARLANGKVIPKRRFVLDSLARTPLKSKVVKDEFWQWTTVIVSKEAPKQRVKALADLVQVVVAPLTKAQTKDRAARIDLRWVMAQMAEAEITSLLVEGGGEVNASFLLGGLVQRVAFFYAPMVLGGRDARKGVAGDGIKNLGEAVKLKEVEWKKVGNDLLLTGRVL